MVKKSKMVQHLPDRKESPVEAGWEPAYPAQRRAVLESTYRRLSSRGGHKVESLPRGKQSVMLGICLRVMRQRFPSPVSLQA